MSAIEAALPRSLRLPTGIMMPTVASALSQPRPASLSNAARAVRSMAAIIERVRLADASASQRRPRFGDSLRTLRRRRFARPRFRAALRMTLGLIKLVPA